LVYHKLVRNRKEQSERVAEILTQIGLAPDVMNRYPHQFSGGQQQRICIGRAIAMKPRLIVCDEAVSALDVSVQAQILNLLSDLKETFGLSYLFISHDLSVVRYLCDHVAVMYKGKIVEQGAVERVYNFPKDPYTQTLLAAIPKRQPVKR
jgi:ABC-type oligopeptide transport system ATPase subunit